MPRYSLGWKVVRKCPCRTNVFISCSSRTTVDYAKDHWAEPRQHHGPLCVFQDKDAALNFVRPTGRYIARCKFRKSKSDNIWQPGEPCTPIYLLPKRTVLAEKVMLIEEPRTYLEAYKLELIAYQKACKEASNARV